MEVCAGSVARGEPETGAKQPRHLGRPDGVAGPQPGGPRRWEQTGGRGASMAHAVWKGVTAPVSGSDAHHEASQEDRLVLTQRKQKTI